MKICSVLEIHLRYLFLKYWRGCDYKKLYIEIIKKIWYFVYKIKETHLETTRYWYVWLLLLWVQFCPIFMLSQMSCYISGFSCYLENLEYILLGQKETHNLIKSIKKTDFEGKTLTFQNLIIQIYFRKKYSLSFTYQFPQMVMQSSFWPGNYQFNLEITWKRSGILGHPRSENPVTASVCI